MLREEKRKSKNNDFVEDIFEKALLKLQTLTRLFCLISQLFLLSRKLLAGVRQAFPPPGKPLAGVRQAFGHSGKSVAGVQQAFWKKKTAVCLFYQNSSHPAENYFKNSIEFYLCRNHIWKISGVP